MRAIPAAAALTATVLLTAPAQGFGVQRLVGNDTGGIIPWSPYTEVYRFAIASDHCARYGKYAHITSVHRQYGDFIGFRCLFGPAVLPGRAVVVTKY